MIEKMHTAVERSLDLAEKRLISYRGKEFSQWGPNAIRELEDREKAKIKGLKDQLNQLEKMMGDENE
jgi:hypothetical protein